MKRINELIKDISCNPFVGIGKPEALKYDFAGGQDELTSKIDWFILSIDRQIIVAKCRFHY